MILLATLAAAATVPLATIAEVRAHPSDFAGARVRLVGWVNSCRPLDCGISEVLDARRSYRGKRLSFEADSDLDQSLGSLLPAKVEIEATVDDACFVKEICLDRAPELRAIHIRRVVAANAPFPDQDQ